MCFSDPDWCQGGSGSRCAAPPRSEPSDVQPTATQVSVADFP